MPAPKTPEAVALWKARMSAARKGCFWTPERRQAAAERMAARNKAKAKPPKPAKPPRTPEEKSETARKNSLKGRAQRILFNHEKRGTSWSEAQKAAASKRRLGYRHSATTRERMAVSAVARLERGGYSARVPLVSTKQEGKRRFLRSKLEAKFVAEMEADSNVVSFQYETVKVPYLVDGLTKLTVVDFLVRTTKGFVLVEVKPSFAHARAAVKLQAVASYAEAQGWGFLIYDETS